jgi:carbon monoxide dehydrogenase subunit G
MSRVTTGSGSGPFFNYGTRSIGTKISGVTQYNNTTGVGIRVDGTLATAMGIGTLSPETQLDVRGNLSLMNPSGTNNNEITIKRPGAPSPTNISFNFNERSDNQNLFLFGFDGTTYKNFVQFNYPNHQIAFPAAGNALVVDAANNRVGVGTAAPSTKLDVVGDAKISGKLAIGGGTNIAKYLSATTTWNPGTVNNLISVAKSVTVTGASIGDPVTVGLSSLNLGGLLLSGTVMASNTVAVTLLNASGSAKTIANGTLRVGVWKH